ncbi:FxLD family lanthipeptide [Nocardiopsis sp. NPDC006832]|uniref:FxLD family lanthipeptide n=1 Tax=Nocardiopsis sp. NPDC006832 TaxID=3157188 RepID=UPI0033DA87B3
MQVAQETRQETSSSPFALDIRLIENSDTTPLINLTDDGCGASCPSSCTTSTAD